MTEREPNRLQVGESGYVEVARLVNDVTDAPIEDAIVTVTIDGPNLPVTPSAVEEDANTYRVYFKPMEVGVFLIDVRAEKDGIVYRHTTRERVFP